ncbi:hypothetical protein KSP40_PGU018958 [Platanthera guangdongensis]|uniref:Uncharacterized protein n=1 Tax=Platanthera guangdongensis TaxID=2320717 RepID=A0ABR2LDP2_9ASPA
MTPDVEGGDKDKGKEELLGATKASNDGERGERGKVRGKVLASPKSCTPVPKLIVVGSRPAAIPSKLNFPPKRTPSSRMADALLLLSEALRSKTGEDKMTPSERQLIYNCLAKMTKNFFVGAAASSALVYRETVTATRDSAGRQFWPRAAAVEAGTATGRDRELKAAPRNFLQQGCPIGRWFHLGGG